MSFQPEDSAVADALVLGWREWVCLPELEIPAIKGKLDTGARTSALHALDIEPFEHQGESYVRFLVQPVQRSRFVTVACKARVIDRRNVKDSGGHAELRYVIETLLQLGAQQRRIELTLTQRRNMRFRMLLGRTALIPDVIVDPAASYRLGRVRIDQHYEGLAAHKKQLSSKPSKGQQP